MTRAGGNLLHPISDIAAVDADGSHCFVGGHGIYAVDDEGREFIEAAGGAWCLALGHGDEEVAEAAAEQMRRLSYVPAFYGRTSEPLEELAARLKAMAPFEAARVFFTGSGSEANDTLVRLLWYANNGKGESRRKIVLAHEHGYHGSAGFSASLTGIPVFHDGFDGPGSFVRRVASPEYPGAAAAGESEAEFVERLASDLETVIRLEGPERIAAFISEPVAAAGGVRIPPKSYFPTIQIVLDRYGIPLAGDEVVTGFWRLGTQWGTEAMNMRPATLTVAKQLTSAYAPLGALLIDEALYQDVLAESRRHPVLGHGFTYGGHPVSAAVALAVLDIYERRQIESSVARSAEAFAARIERLGEHELVTRTASIGLIGMAELDESHGAPGEIGKACARAARDAGLIVRQAGNRTCFCPPLIITPAEVDELFDRYLGALDAVLANLGRIEATA